MRVTPRNLAYEERQHGHRLDCCASQHTGPQSHSAGHMCILLPSLDKPTHCRPATSNPIPQIVDASKPAGPASPAFLHVPSSRRVDSMHGKAGPCNTTRRRHCNCLLACLLACCSSSSNLTAEIFLFHPANPRRARQRRVPANALISTRPSADQRRLRNR
ncbi:uncharacterized protein BKA78DRAFT_166352 [Phyllosticta capitalensis]|uniref:uncharacterized protein n=1 Tax=Phyllosticta capitalensis TaxID=121624 RepID=UPI00312FA42D